MWSLYYRLRRGRGALFITNEDGLEQLNSVTSSVSVCMGSYHIGQV